MPCSVACLHETQARAFVAGELNAEGRAVVEGHAAACATCQALLATLGKAHASDDTVELPPGTERTIAAASATAAADSRPGTEPTIVSRPGTEPTIIAGARPPPPLAEEVWAPGTKVGRYVVLARIGRGGMGTVFRAEDVELGRPVALKRLHADADAESRARLVREARSAAQLQHPNVVTVHEVGEHDGTPFLAMELVEGVTLSGWLRAQPARAGARSSASSRRPGAGSPPPTRAAWSIATSSPTTSWSAATGRARVADFGLARAGRRAATESAAARPRRPARTDDADRLDRGHARVHGARARRGRRAGSAQ